jgi:hypothetical protein
MRTIAVPMFLLLVSITGCAVSTCPVPVDGGPVATDAGSSCEPLRSVYLARGQEIGCYGYAVNTWRCTAPTPSDACLAGIRSASACLDLGAALMACGM